MANMPAVVMNAGDVMEGFTVTRVTPLPQLRGVGYELRHEVTGARLFHLHTDDAENLFSVLFPTPPSDDTGVPHIMEHSVLGGSKKYPVKDPFFEMVKSSMATFINAMTANDFTVYPVSSNVKQDFFNLAEVYWDAVFHPKLEQRTFEREGHRLEFAEPGNINSPLIVKGIVYNEMKGARSGPDATAWFYITKNLWPDTIYGNDSGGDPETIPNLTYMQFIEFHRKWYHPSNAMIFLYGDIPTAEYLKFLAPKLKAYKAKTIEPNLDRQPLWKEPKYLLQSYNIEEGEPTTERSYVVMNWLVGDSANTRDMLALAVLERVLLGNQGAPLRKAIIDSKLGSDVSHSGMQTAARDASFHIGIKGTEPDRTAKFELLVNDTLSKIADEGIPAELIDAAFQQLAYHYLEITSGYPLNVLWRVVETWLYQNDPLPALFSAEDMKALREQIAADPKFLPNLIREKFIHNTHRLTLTLIPEPGLQSRKDKEWEKKLAERKAAMSRTELQTIAAAQADIERILNTPTPPEAMATLPQLKVSDLPAKPRHIPTVIEKAGSMTVLHNDVFANGVNYLHLHLNLGGLPESLWPYLPVYADCVGKMGAAGQDYVAIARRRASHTGGIGFGYDAGGMLSEPNGSLRGANFTLRFLDENADKALDLLEDLIFRLDVRDADRLKEILIQARAYHRTRPAQGGLNIAMAHATRTLSPDAALTCLVHGAPMTHLIEKLAKEQDHLGTLSDQLEKIREFLIVSTLPTASFTGTSSVYDKLVARLAKWSQQFNSKPVAPAATSWTKAEVLPPEGLAAPMDASYCAMVIPAPHMTSPDAPALLVANRLLSMNYLLEEVRFKGSAYGGGSSYNGVGKTLSFHSYRDPWIYRTLEVYRKSLDWLTATKWTTLDVDRAIIGTAKEGERPIRPADATGTALSRYLLGDTRESREARHAGILAATVQSTRGILERTLVEGMNKANICVVSSRERLEADNAEHPDMTLTISDILPPGEAPAAGDEGEGDEE